MTKMQFAFLSIILSVVGGHVNYYKAFYIYKLKTLLLVLSISPLEAPREINHYTVCFEKSISAQGYNSTLPNVFNKRFLSPAAVCR